MEIKQETKSLPRNRKCGNCRYFEPAPLWRKGWCRNPRLYDRRANHLVDAATIDCEQVFRARIYWEPVPITEMSEPAAGGPGYSPFLGQPAETGQADGGRNRNANPNQEGVLRPRALVNNPQAKFNENGNLPVITRRERSTAAPGIVASPSKARRWLVENIPYYDKIDGPISRLNLSKILLGVFIVALVLIVMMLALGGKKGSTDPNQASITDPANSGLIFGNNTPTMVAQPTTASTNKTNATATPTLSNLVPTATTAPTVAPTTKVPDATAKVVNVGSKGLNLRKDPGKTGAIVAHVPENEIITITSADYKKIDGIEWWPISYKGTTGWVDAEYLQKN